MLKFNYKDTVFFVNFAHNSHKISVVNFEHVIAGWNTRAFPQK